MKKSFFHLHWFNKPIAYIYTSAYSRDIIFQCRCGKKVSIEDYRDFLNSFPEEPPKFTEEEFKRILKSPAKYEKIKLK